MACLRWLPTRKINFAQKIHLFAKYLRNFMSRTKAALNGHREKNSFRNKKWVLQSLGIRPRLCVSAAWMFVACDIYLWITKVQAALIYTRATFIEIFASQLWFIETIRDWRSVTESRCGSDLGRMSLITELITHKLRITALLFIVYSEWCFILIVSCKTIKEMWCIFPFIHPTRHSNNCIVALTTGVKRSD